MINLSEWGSRWGIPPDAIDDLAQMMGVTQNLIDSNLSTESGVQSVTRLNYAKKGSLLWRNNVGAFQHPNGAIVRFGLANESKKVNSEIKSSDLIGLRPVKITSAMTGLTIGQFVAIECKKPDWKYANTPRERAQLKFIQLVLSKGGHAQFTVDGIVTD